ncbi:hypothetical protein [Terrabacter sp. MAHUQ-38]|uniref:hypothetical protein n=1 Tax=unclassified Terrabacter TaxID=2630222 RepID=UPI001CAA492C|nr:hypothetical protein [Terrabacter sp. MAHUQ-38]
MHGVVPTLPNLHDDHSPEIRIMTNQLRVEPLGGHDYLVRVREGEERLEILIQASPDVVERLGLAGLAEARIVEATAAFLIERQLAADLPQALDLDDVAAAYDNYLSELERRLSP